MAIAVSSGAGRVHAQGIISASPDVTIDLGAGVVSADEDVIADNQHGIVFVEDIGALALPRTSDMIALSVDGNGDRLIAFETTTLLAGGVVARPGDVVRYNGEVLYSIEFDASAEGLPSTVATDAVSAFENRLILSFDTTVDLGAGLVVADEDLVSWNGSTIRRILNGSAAGIDSALDIDAVQYLGGSVFLVSFDTSGEVGGVVFDDEDVLRMGGGNWSMEFDASAANSAWSAADLDAIVVPESGFPGLVGAGCGLLVARGRRRRRARFKHAPSARESEEESSHWRNRMKSNGGKLMHNQVKDRTRKMMGGRLAKANRLSPANTLMIFPLALIWVLVAPSAYAVDGIAEINHSCAVLTGCFSGDTAGYPITINGSAGASYRLTSNLVVPDENTGGISIAVSSIGIDLNNFEIVRAGCEGATVSCTPISGTGSGISRSGSAAVLGVSVKNGSIVGMGANGLYLLEQSEVMNLRVRWNRLIGIRVGGGSIVSGNTAYENGSVGIVSGDDGAIVSGNVSTGNGNNGINAASGTTVSGNNVHDNAGDGIFAIAGSSVQGNTVRNNGGYGLQLLALPVYRDNVVVGNTAGTVSGGVNMLGNSCNGGTTCP